MPKKHTEPEPEPRVVVYDRSVKVTGKQLTFADLRALVKEASLRDFPSESKVFVMASPFLGDDYISIDAPKQSSEV